MATQPGGRPGSREFDGSLAGRMAWRKCSRNAEDDLGRLDADCGDRDLRCLGPVSRMNLPQVCQKLEGKLVASCQAPEGDVFCDSHLIARFAQAALAGGAAGIRANGTADIRAIRRITSAPILGIQKGVLEDGKVLITPSLEAARALVEAGADMVAVDATLRGQRHGALERIRRIKQDLGVPVFGDIATVDE